MQSRKPGIFLFAIKFRTSPSNVTIGNDYRVKLSQCLGKGKVTPDEEILRGVFSKSLTKSFFAKHRHYTVMYYLYTFIWIDVIHYVYCFINMLPCYMLGILITLYVPS